MSVEIIAIVSTAALAFIGYAITYWNNLILARRAERLQLITAQLNELYGPMFVITQTARALFTALRTKARSEGRKFADGDKPRGRDDVSEWRIWVENVFLPLNNQLEEIIIQKAYLIREEEMPKCLKDFVAHTAGYKVLVKKWELGDFFESTSIIPYPEEINAYAEKSYRELKQEQLQIIVANKQRKKF